MDVALRSPRIHGTSETLPFHQGVYQGLGEYSLLLVRTYQVDSCSLVGAHLVCFTDDGYIYDSSRGARSFRDRGLFRVCDEGGIDIIPSTTVRLGGQYLVVGGKAGYYHWLTEILPRLAHCSRVFNLKTMKVLMRPTSARYALEMLALMGVQPTFEASAVIHVDSAILPTHLVHHKRQGRYSPELPALTRYYTERYLKVPKRSYPERIYVSRDDAPTRRVENEREILGVLERFGFERVVLSELPIAEQIGLFRHAKFVVGPHGAGLTNVLFCEPGARLLELYGENLRAASPFRNLAQLSDVEYALLLCPQGSAPRGYKRAKDADLVVDCEQLELALSDMMTTTQSIGLPRKSYAQDGEDLLIDRLLGGKRPITYVDIGCPDPERHSNTYLHYLAAGHGVCVDTLPEARERYRRIRPRDRFVNAGVAKAEGVLEYFAHENPAFNTFSRKQAAKVARKSVEKGSAGRRLVSTIKVPVKPLMSLLADLELSDDFITNLDLLSIDVGTHLGEVVDGIDFSRLRPKLVVAAVASEANVGFRGVMEFDVVRRLEGHGYRVSAYTGRVLFLSLES